MADIFVSMPFDKSYFPVWKMLQDAATTKNLTIYRVDQQQVGESLPDAIYREIKKSRIVIADVTGNNPNVFHEIGLADALGKPLILVCQNSPSKLPFNIRHLRVLVYKLDKLEGLRVSIDKALQEATSPSENLRAMLVPGSLGYPSPESRFIIAASPLSYRRAIGRSGGYAELRRTSSDHVGIRGILRGFGVLFGFDALPDIIDPEDSRDEVLEKRMNIYSIASPKANRWTGLLLGEYNKRWVPRIEFRADPSTRNLRNVRVSIFSDNVELHPPGWDFSKPGDRYYHDYGIILRAPNPHYKDQMAYIIAGRSSLGTEAASTALNEPKIIEQIRNRLSGQNIDIEDHSMPFWVMVSMKRSKGDDKEEAIRGSLNIHQVNGFENAC